MRKVIVCDIDGSLMPNSAGLYVSSAVRDQLIHLQEKGGVIVLNSARIFQGVYPLAKQLKMDEFGGVVLSGNGCHAYDMSTQKVLFTYPIEHTAVEWLWKYGQTHQMGVSFTQPEYAVCSRMEIGFELDQKNCDVDYIVTNHIERYLNQEVVKCTLASVPEKLSSSLSEVRQKLHEKTNLEIIASTPELYDIIRKDASKDKAVERVLTHLGSDWAHATVIGDGIGDARCIELADFGCTLENGKAECKKVADLIVPSCLEDGCLVWLNQVEEWL